MSADERHEHQVRRAQDVESHLLAVVVEPFFGHVVDQQRGGFQQTFDAQWNPAGDPAARFSVFQARATYAASALAENRKGISARYKPIAQHGFRELHDVLWDKEMGGFYWGRSADGKPTEKYGFDQKMTYGQAFCVYALAAYYGATKDPEGLKLAQASFAWLDQHAHDDAHGGYFEVMRRNGVRVTGGGNSERGGWPLSLKTSNTSLHLLEAFLELYRVDPDPAVRLRLLEMFELVRDRIVQRDTGSMAETFQDDWVAVSRRSSYGHDVEAAHLLLAAAKALDLQDDAHTAVVAKKLVDRALSRGFDWDHGGTFENQPDGSDSDSRPKVWWAQDEMLLALAAMDRRFGESDDRYAEAYQLQWKALRDDFTDRTHIGRVKSIDADGKVDYGKTDDWTEAYHDVRCLLAVSAIIREKSSSTPASP